MLLYVNIIAGIISLPIVFLYRESIFALTLGQLSFTLLTGALWSLNGYLGNLTTEKAEVSIREPLVQLQVVWAVVIGLIIFNESLNPQQMIGIGLIILASLVLTLKRNFFKVHIDKKTLLIIFVYTIVTAIVAAMDKHIMSFLAPQAYLLFNFFVPILFLLPFVKFHRKELSIAQKNMSKLILLSIVFMCAFITTLFVYKNFDFAISYPLLKIATPLTAVLGILIFKENNNLNKKIIAIVLATLGVILIKTNF